MSKRCRQGGCRYLVVDSTPRKTTRPSKLSFIPSPSICGWSRAPRDSSISGARATKRKRTKRKVRVVVPSSRSCRGAGEDRSGYPVRARDNRSLLGGPSRNKGGRKDLERRAPTRSALSAADARSRGEPTTTTTAGDVDLPYPYTACAPADAALEAQ